MIQGMRKDLTGLRFGKLRVASRSHVHKFPSGQSQQVWNCDCDCGGTAKVMGGNLTNPNTHTVSCGCVQRERTGNATRTHGYADKHRLYGMWCGMWRRCTSPSCKVYRNYGGRGIKVCERWKDFALFLEDMESSFRDGLSIDRIDNNGDYEPKNCRWATMKEQANNTRKSVKICYKGKRLSVGEWSKITGIKTGTIWGRIKRKWSVKDTLSLSLWERA